MAKVTKPVSNYEYEIAGLKYYQQALSGGQLNCLMKIFTTIPSKFIEEGEIGQIVLHLVKSGQLPEVLSILLIPAGDVFTDNPQKLKKIEKSILSEDAVELIGIGKEVISDFLSVNKPSLRRLKDIFPIIGSVVDGFLEYMDTVQGTVDGMKSTSK